MKSYEKFLVEWHALTKKIRSHYVENDVDEANMKKINMKFLQIFYLTPYEGDDFYQLIFERMTVMEHLI